MGVELRRVPPGWEHPKDMTGKYIPLFGTPCAEAQKKWDEDEWAWKAGEHPFQKKNPKFAKSAFDEYDGPRPECACGPLPRRGSYVPFTVAEATHWQVYEDTTEGTPFRVGEHVSPVFPSPMDFVPWLVGVGYRIQDAEAFVEVGHVPTATRIDNAYLRDIHGAERFRDERARTKASEP